MVSPVTAQFEIEDKDRGREQSFKHILDSAATMGDNHLRAAFRVAGQKPLEAVAWGAMDSPLGPALIGARGRRFHAAGKLELSHWGGRARVRLRLDDVAEA